MQERVNKFIYLCYCQVEMKLLRIRVESYIQKVHIWPEVSFGQTGSNNTSVAEDEVMRILLLMRNFIPAYSQIKDKTWDVPKTAGNSWDLMGKTIGTEKSIWCTPKNFLLNGLV